jgi:hypothetical protein
MKNHFSHGCVKNFIYFWIIKYLEMKIRLSVLALGLTFFFGCQGQDPIMVTPVVEDDPIYSFFVAGHAYGKPIWDTTVVREPGLYKPFVAHFDELNNNPNLHMGFLTGDLVQDANAENWEVAEAQIASLDMPIYIAPGNHDSNGEAPYADRVDSTYRSFTYHGDLFLVLDTNLKPWHIAGAQLQFVKDELAAYRGDGNIYVFFHSILWFETEGRFAEYQPNWWQSRPADANFYTELLPCFDNQGKHVYFFAGDAGARAGFELFYYDQAHVTFIASGMGGNKHDNYLIVNVLPNHKIAFEIIELAGVNEAEKKHLVDYQWPETIDLN